MSLAIVAVAAALLSSSQAGHWSGRLAGGSHGKDHGEYRISGTLRGTRVRNGRVGLNVATCGGRDRWTARRASR